MRRKSHRKRHAQAVPAGKTSNLRYKWVYTCLVLLSLILVTGGCMLGYSAFIPTHHSLIAAVSGGLAAFFLLPYPTSAGISISSMRFINLWAGGVLAFFLLASINHYGKHGTAYHVLLPILEKGDVSGGRGAGSHCRKPFAKVVLNGVSCRIMFDCGYLNQMGNAKTVELTLMKGALGYPVILDKTLQ